MYRIRAVCQNPACKDVFGVEFAGIGPLEGKTFEIAFKLSKILRGKHAIPYRAAKMDNEVQIPKVIECPKCHSVFPRSDLTFFVYNASATQTPD